MTSTASRHRPSDPLRLFVAIYPTPEVARGLQAACAAIDLPAHRTVPEDQVHLTLQFIGDTPARDLDRTIESVERSAAGLAAFGLAATRLGTLPRRGRSRLVAATVDTPPTLLEIKRRLAQRLAGKPVSRPRPYLPHLTLLRFRAPAAFDLDMPLAAPLTFPVSAIVLVRSTLHPGGAHHGTLFTHDLGGTAGAAGPKR